MRRWASSWEMWIAVAVLAGALALTVTTLPPAGPSGVSISPAERVDRLRRAWSHAKQHTVEGCPTVRELERLLPDLRGISPAERDYAGHLLGVDCRR